MNIDSDSNGPKSGDNQQDESQPTAREALAKNRSKAPASRSVLTVPWREVVPASKEGGLRPFIVTTGDLKSAVSASDFGERRIEAEELWLVKATNRENAIYQIWDHLKPNIACVDAFDVSELRALARAAESISSAGEEAVTKISTPWCADVAFAD